MTLTQYNNDYFGEVFVHKSSPIKYTLKKCEMNVKGKFLVTIEWISPADGKQTTETYPLDRIGRLFKEKFWIMDLNSLSDSQLNMVSKISKHEFKLKSNSYIGTHTRMMMEKIVKRNGYKNNERELLNNIRHAIINGDTELI